MTPKLCQSHNGTLVRSRGKEQRIGVRHTLRVHCLHRRDPSGTSDVLPEYRAISSGTVISSPLEQLHEMDESRASNQRGPDVYRTWKGSILEGGRAFER